MQKEQASKLFKILGVEARISIVKELYGSNEICACKFLNTVECGQPTLSHHLNILLKSGLLTQRKEGTRILYSCNRELVDELMSFIQS